MMELPPLHYDKNHHNLNGAHPCHWGKGLIIVHVMCLPGIPLRHKEAITLVYWHHQSYTSSYALYPSTFDDSRVAGPKRGFIFRCYTKLICPPSCPQPWRILYLFHRFFCPKTFHYLHQVCIILDHIVIYDSLEWHLLLFDYILTSMIFAIQGVVALVSLFLKHHMWLICRSI